MLLKMKTPWFFLTLSILMLFSNKTGCREEQDNYPM